MTRISRLALAFALFAIVPPHLVAQEDDPVRSFGGSVDVDLVTVELVAVDGEGAPVLDLDRGELRLWEDGEEIPIIFFDPPPASESSSNPANRSDSSGTTEPGAPTESPPGQVIVFVDYLHIGVHGRAGLFEGLKRILAPRMAEGDQVMLVTFDGTISIEVPFTSSRREISKALDRMGDLDARQIMAGLERRRALDSIQQAQMVETNNAERGLACLSIGDIAMQHATAARSKVLQTIGALGDFVNTLAGIQGRKTLIHVSDGIPLIPGFTPLQYAIEMCDGTAAREGIANTIDSQAVPNEVNDRWNPQYARTELLSLDTSNEWRRLAAHANAHRVTFYPVQISGLAAPNQDEIGGFVRMTGNLENLSRYNDQDSLVLLAEETGGRAIVNTNRFVRELERAVDDGRVSYALGFSPTPGGEGELHELRVEVDRPSVKLRYRQSYFQKTRHQQMAEKVLSALVHGLEHRPEAIRVRPGRVKASADAPERPTVRVAIPLDEVTLLPSGDVSEGLVTVFVALRNVESGEATDVRQTTIPIRVAGPSQESESWVYDLAVRQPPGTYQVAVGLLDEVGDTVAYRRAELEVEAPVRKL